MTEQPIPAPMLHAAQKEIIQYLAQRVKLADWHTLPYVHAVRVAEVAVEAANVPALLAERDALRALLLRDIASNGHLDDDFLAMRGVAALTAEIFSTETDKIEAYSWLGQANEQVD